MAQCGQKQTGSIFIVFLQMSFMDDLKANIEVTGNYLTFPLIP